jgi:putative acetyltransferase
MVDTTVPELLADGDAAAVAALVRRSREQAMPWLPTLHTPEEDRAFFAGELEHGRAWGVRAAGELVGVAVERGGFLSQLYVAPGWQGRGIGSALLAQARAAAVEPLQLWVFARNTAARRFYARHGFAEAERTDGSANEEREPDLRLVDDRRG